MEDLYKKIASFIASKKFFYGVVLLLILEATWIALSSRYPMAFDESFHLGAIRLYMQHPSPWWNGQPLDADVLGAISRDPSYIYHWLMSFPYRLINEVFHDTIRQVIALRLINVIIFASGLLISRKLLLKATDSRALVNLSLLFLVLIPVIPSLAGQINYDNLLFVLVPSALLLAILFVEQLRDTKQFNLKLLASLMILCMVSSLVKYAFLPIFLVIIVFVLIYAYSTYRAPKRYLKKELKLGFQKLSRLAKIGLVVGFVVSSGLFFERYGMNTAKYHTPLPECNQVLSIERCQSYGPWKRNHDILRSKGQPFSGTVHFTFLTFAQHWIYVLYRSMFYVLNGPDSSYTVGEPLLLPAKVAVLVLGAGLSCLVGYWLKIFKGNYVRTLLLGTLVIYAGILWLQNYADYLHLGQPVALQGRYLTPVLAPLFILLGVSIAWALRSYKKARVVITVTAIALFLQGGGVITFMVRSDDSWYLDNSVSVHINKAVQPVVKKLVIGE